MAKEKKLTKEEKKEARKAFKQKGQGIISEFKKFILRGNVIDMAVGVIVATAFTKIVTSLTNGIFMPLITWLVGDMQFDEVKTVLREEVLDAEGAVVQAEIALNWGTVIEAIISFILIALIIFMIIKITNSIRARLDFYKDKLKKKIEEEKNKDEVKEDLPVVQEEVKVEPSTNELLQEIITLLKDKNEVKEETNEK